MRTLYYYFAVIARSIEGDESDAAIPGGADFRRRPTGYGGQVAWVTASAVALRASDFAFLATTDKMAGQAR
ncbi:MAG: hypothetical protein GXP52_04705 [Deltaproteobacteria bacterium]|nr:hypothetical protein [Deltaproteobacteria bacterium]